MEGLHIYDMFHSPQWLEDCILYRRFPEKICLHFNSLDHRPTPRLVVQFRRYMCIFYACFFAQLALEIGPNNTPQILVNLNWFIEYKRNVRKAYIAIAALLRDSGLEHGQQFISVSTLCGLTIWAWMEFRFARVHSFQLECKRPSWPECDQFPFGI